MAKYFSNDEHDELETAFKLFDLDMDGLIDGNELGNIARYLGHATTNGELQTIVRRICGSTSNTISFAKFLQIAARLMKVADAPLELFKDGTILCLQCLKNRKERYFTVGGIKTHNVNVHRDSGHKCDRCNNAFQSTVLLELHRMDYH